EGMAANVNQAQLDANLRSSQQQQQGAQKDRELDQQQDRDEWGKIQDVARGVGSFFGKMIPSDIRAKDEIYTIPPTGEGGIIRQNPYGEGPMPRTWGTPDQDPIIRENPYGAPPTNQAGAPDPSTGSSPMQSLGAGLSAFGGEGSARIGISPLAPTAAYAPRG